ncbi:hypothetical protein [Cylindrospermopsis raciborskii]|uniref:hypothetical protein n=1 Tax=Cylindrospermopsis raciborskii TaxID=77022 RepID=UPI0001C16C63|nr:hypothetical protein [Cylindrospermopsis raciborskii]EFA68527.1 hypothetical protein CRC_02974 [Cylindrospermopsis raciborskii CS-505]
MGNHAIAYLCYLKLDTKETGDRNALEQGLFLIRPAGDSVAIDMKEDFQAKVW